MVQPWSYTLSMAGGYRDACCFPGKRKESSRPNEQRWQLETETETETETFSRQKHSNAETETETEKVSKQKHGKV